MLERRFFKTGTELRGESMGDELSVIGYASVWNSLSEPLGNGKGVFRERLCMGCFTRSLQSDRDVKALFNHDPSLILGRKRNGTLTLAEDGHGLRFKALLPNTTVARDVYNLIQRRDISDCSFAFECNEDQWDDCEDPDNADSRVARRTILSANLLDVSVVASPAYKSTSVNIGSQATAPLDKVWGDPTPRSMEAFFPEGVPQSFPAEVRSRIFMPSRSVKSHRRVIDFILS